MCQVQDYPPPGGKTLLQSFAGQGGGQAGTAAVTVARLGGAVAMAGRVGGDEWGEHIRASFVDEGVDAAQLYTDPAGTSHLAICVVTAGGERTILYTRGTKRLLEPEELDLEYLLDTRVLLLDTHHGTAAVHAAHEARRRGLPVVTDLERDTPATDDLFRVGSHHVLPRSYLLRYTGTEDQEQAVRALWSEYEPELVAVTAGSEGSWAYTAERVVHQPALEVGPVVDTTGAGDAFHGAFAYGLALGYDLEANLHFAALVAALKCRKLGGRAGLPTTDELQPWWPEPLPGG
jgi:sugar/nucleoside kinase (ribokinase family)